MRTLLDSPSPRRGVPVASAFACALSGLGLVGVGCAPQADPGAVAGPPGSANVQRLDASASGAGRAATGPGRFARESFGDDALGRAAEWVDLGLMYSWSPNWNGYRTDCSGLVSYAWGLPAPGHTTYSLGGGVWDDGSSYPISWDDLSPGDALNFPGDPNAGTGHVMLFARWADRNAGTLYVYEEYDFGHPAEYRLHSLDDVWPVPIRRYTPIRSAARPADTQPAPAMSGPSAPSSGGGDCSSTTLGGTAASGTCVESVVDGQGYQCVDGSWQSWDGGSSGPGGDCTRAFPFCHSDTLGRDVAARTCVQSRFDSAWYQCGEGGVWQAAPSADSDGSGPLGPCSSSYAL